MKKALVLLVFLGLVATAILYRTKSTEPVRVVEAKVVALVDLDDSGKRLITVVLPDGTQQAVQTHAPYFFKVGDKAYLATYRRYLFDDIHQFVTESEARSDIAE